MSRMFLDHLNDGKEGLLHAWMNTFKGEPRMAWYPSANTDFRDMLYFSRAFMEQEPGTLHEPPPPDVFLHTDYLPWSHSSLLPERIEALQGHIIHDDHRTRVTVLEAEELPRHPLPLDARIVDFPENQRNNGRTLFMTLQLDSNRLGRIVAPLIYAVAENAAFCALRMLPNHAAISHAVHVRYGGGCGGGGKSTGIWMSNVLKRLHCEVLASDEHVVRQSGDERVYELYPSLRGIETASFASQTIRTIPSDSWSGHGNVTINRIS